MLKVVHAIVTGLVGAALLHVIIVLALPHYVRTDAYARVEGLGAPGIFHRLAGPFGGAEHPTTAALVNQDPFLGVSACTVDVSGGPVRLYAEGDVTLWSVVVFDKESNEVYSMNDRTSVAGALDILLATADQLPAIRKALPEDLAQSILVEMPPKGGYAVLRAFSPRPSFRPAADAFLADAECGRFEPTS